MLALLALLIATPAQAQTYVLGAAGGYDYSVNQLWVGGEAALHPDGTEGLAPIARVNPLYGFLDERVYVKTELGLAVQLPHEGVPVRLAAVLHALTGSYPYRLPVQLAGEGTHRFGLVPGGTARIEFEYGTDDGPLPFVFGVEGGLTAQGLNYACDDPMERETCMLWQPAFLGGFYGRARLGLAYVEAMLGPSPRLGVGMAF